MRSVHCELKVLVHKTVGDSDSNPLRFKYINLVLRLFVLWNETLRSLGSQTKLLDNELTVRIVEVSVDQIACSAFWIQCP